MGREATSDAFSVKRNGSEAVRELVVTGEHVDDG